MSAYPPPPPGPYPPPYNRDVLRAQRRMLKDQAKMQRQQIRMQMRLTRRRSIVGPLIILAIGVVFLLEQMGRLSWMRSLEWYGQWWPAVLILAGMVLLAEWALDQGREDSSRHTRAIGGGVVFLLIVLALAGVSSHVAANSVAWSERTFGNGFGHFDHVFGDRHDGYDSASSAIATGAGLVIRNPHGDVTVTGASVDGQVHVNVHTQAYAWHEGDADSKAKRLRPVFSSEGGDLVMTVAAVDGGQADLTVELPRGSAVTVEAGHGDVNVSEVHAAVTLSANHGDVSLSGIDGAVQAHVSDDNATITIHSVTGTVSLEGRTGDVDISEVTGAVMLHGDFFGSTHLQHVNGAVGFESTRTKFQGGRLDGEFSIASDSLDASEMMGPVVLKTHDKNITLDRIEGGVDVTDRNGTVSVTNAPPLAPITIQNQHGSVDVGLPASAGFVLSAQTKHGEMENDFGLEAHDSDEMHTLTGTVGGGGPTVSIATTDGDVTLRKSSVAPLPPAPPAPPRIGVAPLAAPPAPKAPGVPKPPAAPKPPTTGATF
jgi:DUF4097 and DUF4098 domain-containing protein YvlB